jgi:hypothetical protein
MADSFPASIKRSVLATRNQDLDCDYLCDLRALYDGGHALLHQPEIMRRIFPKHMRELPEIYAERCNRAVYVAIASTIIDFMTASLAVDPIRVKVGDKEEPDEWYENFAKDVSPPGGDKTTLSTFCRDRVTEMLITRTAWSRVDLPRPGEFPNLGAQVDAVNLNAYAVPVPTESVVDWKEGPGGELEWVIVEDVDCPRNSPTDSRDTVVETWKMWTSTGWAKYQISRKKNEPVNPDKDVPKMGGLDGEGVHTFGRVPFARTILPKGLWAMDTLDSLARSHLNLRSTLDWALKQDGDPQLYEFLGPEDETDTQGVSEAQEDPHRAVNQTRGPGHVQIRGKDDKAMYLSPDPAAAKVMLQTLDKTRDEMHAVMHMMAMTVDQNKTALGRSADSKKEDRATTDVVLTALGQYLREHIVAVFELVSRGRGDAAMVGAWTAEGAARFQSDSGDTVIARAVEIATVPIKSPTAQRRIQLDSFKGWVADNTTEEELKTVERELQENVTLDSMDPPPAFPKPGAAKKEATPEGEDKEEEAA